MANQEYNRSKLGKYISDKKILHSNAINKLFNSKSGVAVNINSPGGIETLKGMLKDQLVAYAKKLKNMEINPDAGTKQLPAGCTNWSEFKQNYRCKYSDPPCFGCVNPT